MEGSLLVSKEDNIKTLIRIDKILNCRFEREKKLYLDKQLKYEIRKKMVKNQWQGIGQGVFKTERISEEILVNEILSNMWLVNKNINPKEYKDYLEPLLDSCDDKIYYRGMEKILNNKIQVREDIKILLLKKYYEKKSRKELIKIIYEKDKHLENSEICFQVLKKIVNGNGNINEKINCLNEAYKSYKEIRNNFLKLGDLWQVILKENSQVGIEAIMENYIKKDDFNEDAWIRIMYTENDIAMKEIEKFARSDDFDRAILRSLLNGIQLRLLKTKDLASIQKAAESIVKIVKGSPINGANYIECRFLIEKYKEHEQARNRLLEIIGKYSKCYKGGKNRTIINTGIKEVDSWSRDKAMVKSYEFFIEVLKLDLEKRKKVRLNHLRNEYEKLEKNRGAVRNVLINNHKCENFSELIFYLIDEGRGETSNNVVDLVIEKCELDWDLEDKLIEYIKEKHPKKEKLIRYIHKENFELFKEIYGRKI